MKSNRSISTKCAQIIRGSSLRDSISCIEVLVDVAGKDVIAVYISRIKENSVLNSIDDISRYLYRICVDQCSELNQIKLVVVDSSRTDEQQQANESWLKTLTVARIFVGCGEAGQLMLQEAAKNNKPLPLWVEALGDYVTDIEESEYPNEYTATLENLCLTPITDSYAVENLQQLWDNHPDIMIEFPVLYAVCSVDICGDEIYDIAVKSTRFGSREFSGKVAVVKVAGMYDEITKEAFQKALSELQFSHDRDSERLWTIELYHYGSAYILMPIRESVELS